MIVLEDSPSDSPTIKLRWYGRGEGASYAIVQHSPSCVWVTAVGAAWSRSGVAVPVGPADASEGGIRAAENCVAGGNWIQDLSSDTMLEDPPSASPTIKLRWYGRGEGVSYAIVQQIDLSRTYGTTASLICYALVMFMIYPWIKIKLKVIFFQQSKNLIVGTLSLWLDLLMLWGLRLLLVWTLRDDRWESHCG
jgi:hypothetical protein